MKVLFMGTPSFAVPSLEALLASRHAVLAVVTQPDRPAGRGLEVRPSPVKEIALRNGVPLRQPSRIKGPEFPGEIRALATEILVVVAFGRILPQAVLDAAPRGGVNVHASLLPRWRGAAPVARAIAAGDAVTGVTTMRMIDRLDAGEVMLQRSTPIGDEETAGALEARLARMGAEILIDTLDAIEAGQMALLPQQESHATFAPILTKEEGRIEWPEPAAAIARRVRAFDPWPVAFTASRGRTLRLRRARPAPGSASGAPPGTVLAAGAAGVRVACGGDTVLDLIEVQPEGKRRMSGAEAASGRYLAAGDRLG